MRTQILANWNDRSRMPSSSRLGAAPAAVVGIVLGISLTTGACSSRNHNSGLPDSSSSNPVMGFMTIADSPTGSDDVENLRLDSADTCTLADNQSFTATLASERLAYKLELGIRDITEEFTVKNCQQASTNTTIKQNGDDVLKFFGCYASVMAGVDSDFNEYDTFRKDPEMSDYTYNGDQQAGCSMKVKIDLQSRIFEATDIVCKRMAITIAGGRYANPIYNDRAINLTASDVRCQF